MSFQWIDPEMFSFNCLLLMDRCLIEQICLIDPADEEYSHALGIALAHNTAVAWYFAEKAPEIAETVQNMVGSSQKDCTHDQVYAAERFVLDRNDWAVVYVYPEIMNTNCPYIAKWNKARLFELADFSGKTVLDVGAGTGRLAFAAAEQAKHVYASEPVDRLREFMREKIRREKIENVTVLDGLCDCLPYEDDSFDIVMSGHVLGDNYDAELAELERVTKDGGWILNCPGEDDRPASPNQELIRRGFEEFYYASCTGGDVYRHRKQVKK